MTLKEARVRAGMTQREAAEKLGITNAAISMWESGKNSPRFKRIKELAALYGVAVSEIVGDGNNDDQRDQGK